jgi:hypothetical protein
MAQTKFLITGATGATGILRSKCEVKQGSGKGQVTTETI